MLYGLALRLEVHPLAYWTIALVAGAVAAFANRSPGAGSFRASHGEFLCDSCKYNDARYCSRPERPNALKCPDYKLPG